MRKSIVLLSFAMLAGVLAGCTQGPASGAIRDAEAAVAAIQPDAEKYFPDQFKALQASLEKLHQNFAEGRYAGVQMDAKSIRSRAEKLGEMTVSKKSEVTEEWEALSLSLPGLVGKLEAKVAELAQLRRLPKGVDKDDLAAAQSDLATIHQSWEAALSEVEAKPLDALEKARTAKAKITEIAARVGFPTDL